MEAPVVTVITPFFNTAAFLEEAIESVRAQTYRSWELLLVDDGATDGSGDIARRYAERFPSQIAYIHHPGHANRGISATVNAGMTRARGTLIALLDGDDVWLPAKLEEQVALLVAHPDAAMVYGNTLFWYSWSGDPVDAGRDFSPRLGVPLNQVSPPPHILTRCLRGEAAVPCTCSVLMRAALVRQVGGFDEGFPVNYSDQAFYTKVLATASVFVADRVWDKYRMHPASAVATARRTGTMAGDRRRYLDFTRAYLQRQGLAHGALWSALQRAIREDRPTGLRRIASAARTAARRLRLALEYRLPERTRHRLHRLTRPPGGPRFGNMRRLSPVSPHFGYDRGRPVDRHYIEAFLHRHADDVRGRVLEAGDDTYTRRFGGDRVTTRDVLHVSGNAHATFVDDLATGERLPSGAFDCIILTQTLHLIFDVHAAVRTLHRILKPGGVLLATIPGISPIDSGEWKASWYWSLTPAAARRLLAASFASVDVQVESHGNVLTACAFLQGLAQEDLSPRELEVTDPRFPVIVTARARKATVIDAPQAPS